MIAQLNGEIELDPKNYLTQILCEKPAELTVLVSDGRPNEKVRV